MKTLLFLIILTSSSISFGFNYEDKVPGKGYTYGEFLLNRSIVNKLRANDNRDKLQGQGMEFFGNVSIKKEMSIDSEGKKVEKNKYNVYVRNCGTIEVPEKDEKIMKTINSGTRIRMFLEGSSCKISDWEKF